MIWVGTRNRGSRGNHSITAIRNASDSLDHGLTLLGSEPKPWRIPTESEMNHVAL